MIDVPEGPARALWLAKLWALIQAHKAEYRYIFSVNMEEAMTKTPCGAVAGSSNCTCYRPAGHDGWHRCDHGFSWEDEVQENENQAIIQRR